MPLEPVSDARLVAMRDDAIAALERVLRDSSAKPSETLRAAELILRASPSASGTGGEGLDGMTDDELLAAARGEGGAPPKEGPQGGSAKTDPPTPNGDRFEKPGFEDIDEPIAKKGGPISGPISPESHRGSAMGPKKGPGRPKKDKNEPASIAKRPEKGDTPPRLPPNPWE